jgi:AmmeMemoRadiSam system protein B
MQAVRAPAVAGSFYPATAPALHQAIENAFADALPLPVDAPIARAIIAPHAGYMYSGPVAASAYRWIERSRSTIRRVVLLGPCHRVFLRGMAVPTADAFETPLGLVGIDTVARAAALRLPGVVADDGAHEGEHSVEVQLPFLQTVLTDFTVLPIVVGDASQHEVAAVIDALWDGPETLVVVSTDLSHYHSYEVADRLDAGTASVIVAMQPEAIDDQDACGARPLRGLLECSAGRRLGSVLVDLRNSGDTAGDRKRVVGYGAFIIA